MRQEIDEIPDAVERLLSLGAADISILASKIRAQAPSSLMSVARGSSDHACTYLKYASELILQQPMASIGPSVQSIYGAEFSCHNSLAIAISQSGMSPDIVQLTKSIVAGGSRAIAITNTPDSDLAKAATDALNLYAGPEKSVAATKTFVSSLVAGLLLLAEIKQEHALIKALHALPEQLNKASQVDWSVLIDAFTGNSLFVIGRGPCLAISNEAALKFKETSLTHAESYSSAELLHGPVSIVGSDFPILAFASSDAAEKGLAETADELTNMGATVFATTSKVKNAMQLSHVRTHHWLTDPIALIVSFYGMVELFARNRGINPDTPRHLQKITETL